MHEIVSPSWLQFLACSYAWLGLTCDRWWHCIYKAYVIDFACSQAKKLLRQKDVDDEMAALVYQMKVSEQVNGRAG